jgi:hypothetical protein
MPRHLTRIAMAIAAGCLGPSSLTAQVARGDSIGKIRLVVEEGAPDNPYKEHALSLHMATIDQYPCLGFGIGHSFTRRQDTLEFVLSRIVAPIGDLCNTAIGPAELRRELPVSAGHYTLLIGTRTTRDRIELDVTDSSFVLMAKQPSFIALDERVWWRRPTKSMAFYCQNVNVALAVCDDIKRWLAARADVQRVRFAGAGVNPYWPDSSKTPDLTVATFRYVDDSVVRAIRRCFAEVDIKIKQAVGVSLIIQTWKGERITAWSKRSYDEPHTAIPKRVTDGPACVGQ